MTTPTLVERLRDESDYGVAALRREAAAHIERLEEALNQIMPRYIELYEAAGLGNPNESIAVDIARKALEGT